MRGVFCDFLNRLDTERVDMVEFNGSDESKKIHVYKKEERKEVVYVARAGRQRVLEKDFYRDAALVIRDSSSNTGPALVMRER